MLQRTWCLLYLLRLSESILPFVADAAVVCMRRQYQDIHPTLYTYASAVGRLNPQLHPACVNVALFFKVALFLTFKLCMGLCCRFTTVGTATSRP